MDTRVGLIPSDGYFLGIFVTSHSLLNILWQVNYYRPRLTGPCNKESFFDNPPQVFSVSYRYGMFTDISGNTYDIYLLKGIVANQMSGYLSRKANQRNAVIVGSCNTGNQIGGTWSAGNQTDTHFTC
ncbi:hypothetical protein D3C81_1824890 [compost metagenome]